jgi:hypothetical protein
MLIALVVTAILQEVAQIVVLSPPTYYEVGKVLQPVLDQRRSTLDNFNTPTLKDIAGVALVPHFLQNMAKVGTKQGVDKNSLVKVCVSLGTGFKRRNTTHGTS